MQKTGVHKMSASSDKKSLALLPDGEWEALLRAERARRKLAHFLDAELKSIRACVKEPNWLKVIRFMIAPRLPVCK